ncbi:transcription initiation factor TFIID subunit 10-like [Musca autumnalis]|uniref:transcription initiation factor TFIID subunit 10-like n=1 Tax=Musca autumnalis TaxID=221902 RepID=UPI003CE82B39
MIGTNFGIFRPANASSASNGPNHHPTTASPAPGQETTQLSDFMLQLEDYVPTIPDAVTAFYLNSAGFDSNDPRIVRLISVATQKFISDVANDALQHCKTRSNNQNGSSKIVKPTKYTMTMEDLAPALADYGITVRKAQYFP